MNATSNCPYSECDGNGLVYMTNDSTGEFKATYCKCREEKIYNKRLGFANIPKEFDLLTIKSFDIEMYKRQESRVTANSARKMTTNYIKNFSKFEEMGKGLYYYSDTKGSGKTRLAVSLGNVLLKNLKRQVKFITSIDLLNAIKATFNKDSQYTGNQLLESINNVQILIIDDIGVEQPTSWVNEVLFNIFDHRLKTKKITIFTSNCIIEDLKHDDRLKSRLNKMCIPVKMPEEDIRGYLATKENEELQNLLLNS